MTPTFTFSHLEEAISKLSVSIRKQDFLTYFKKFSLLTTTEDSVTLGVVSSFHRDNLSRKFYGEIKQAISSIDPTITCIDIVVDDAIENKGPDMVVECRISLKESEKATKKQQVE
jgi:chromosomal replication initiation ATPase DnaA